MSLIYRSIWHDIHDHVCDIGGEKFEDWVRKVSQGTIVDASTPGMYRSEISIHGCPAEVDVSVERAFVEDHGLNALRASMSLTKHNGRERWRTTLRSWDDTETKTSWSWVDNTVVGDGLDVRTLTLAAPALAVELIKIASTPLSGGIELDIKARRFEGSTAGCELAEIVSDMDRLLPIVVFAESERRFSQFRRAADFDSIVDTTARRIAGQAVVYVADEEAATEFTNCLGRDHGVWDGAYRIYLPDLDPATDRDAWRHRYVTADRYMANKISAANYLSRMLSFISATKRPPPSFDDAKDALKLAQEEYSGSWSSSESEHAAAARAAQEVIELRAEGERLEEENFGHVVALEELGVTVERLADEADRLKRHLDHAVKQLIISGVGDSFVEDESGFIVPRKVTSAEEAVDLSRAYLSDRLKIHPKALRDARDMNTTPAGSVWAQTAWRGFRALHAYALTLETQSWSFEMWCRHSGHPLAWNPSRLAMAETSELLNNSKLKNARVMPVSTEFDPSGQCLMTKHLKIDTSEGPLVPRVYFEVDNATRKIHVGFYGPHKYVPGVKKFS